MTTIIISDKRVWKVKEYNIFGFKFYRKTQEIFSRPTQGLSEFL